MRVELDGSIPVIAIDIDPQNTVCAKQNVELYGISERVEFVVGDFFELAPSIKP
ncbi:hypothetical protein BJ742DRAFT_789056 [Cladochytrium replicatum]|nr:hypothetical protein BJ742DRAFT_789056 [Cladochytrium replicatum]